MPEAGRLEALAAAILPPAEEGNAVVSPFNVAAALTLLVPGARGTTAAELERLLGTDPVASVRDITRQIESLEGTDALGPTAAWVSPALDMKPTYRRAIQEDLAATLAQVDFGDPAAAAAKINRWVARETRERIADLVSPAELGGARLVLTAALYFKAAWTAPLNRIGPRPFELPDGARVEREFMAKRDWFEYGEAPGWRAVRIPYDDGVTSLEVVVPAELEAFEHELAANLELVRGEMERTEVELRLPLFDVRRKMQLGAALAAAGIASAFSEEADFTCITESERLLVSAVIHEALIEVDEKGTLAAAATAVVMRSVGAFASSAPKRMTVDRPFLFVLRGPRSVPLFAGRVTDPAT